MHGAGNDYVYVDCVTAGDPLRGRGEDFIAGLARRISDRHFGVGGDGLVLIMPSDVADVRMRMFNSDGTEAQMCGNASRCVGKYAFESGIARKKEITMETLAGIKVLHIHADADGVVESVTVDMGEPVLRAADVPAISANETMVDEPVECVDGTFRVTAVSMGNPHGVVFVDGPITDRLVHHTGSEMERHPVWPEKANIEFVRVLAPDHIEMRVWERGSGETLACGTGSCASVVAAALNGLTARDNVRVSLLGGELSVTWDEKTGHVFMTGPATIVARGEYYL